MTGQQKSALVITTGAIAIWILSRPRTSTGGASVTTSETFDLGSIGGLTDYPYKLRTFAQAIARAEGFYVAGSVPERANNPGAIKIPGWDGPTLGQNISAFESEDQGWSALYKQLMLIVTGRSRVYSLNDTIATMAARWTGTPTEAENWSANVASTLGVSKNTPLVSLLV